MQEWTWSKLNIAGGNVNATLNGLHDLDLHMREDGLRVDKIILSNPSSPEPVEGGPAESATGTISTNETRTTISYSYDKLYRLTDTEYSGGIVASYGYEYDKVGNMVAYTDTVAAQTTIHTRVFNAMNQMASETQVGVGTKTISYDPNGNMVRIDPAAGSGVPIKFYSYNQRNLMTRASEQGAELQTVAEFRYDGNNDRLEQVAYENGSVATTTTYTNDTIGLTQVLVSDGGPSNTVYQLYGNSLIGQQNGGSALFDTFITDGLGSVRVEMESSGATNYVRTFSPFGETLKEEGSRSSVYGYTGQQEDESTGLIYLRARYYSAELKAFTAYDVWPGESRRPQSLNHYAYVEGNPISYLDPTGSCKDRIEGTPNDSHYHNRDAGCWEYLENDFCRDVECKADDWTNWFNLENTDKGKTAFGAGKWWEVNELKALAKQVQNTIDALRANNIEWSSTKIGTTKFEIDANGSSYWDPLTNVIHLNPANIGGYTYPKTGEIKFPASKDSTVYHELAHPLQSIGQTSLPLLFEEFSGNCNFSAFDAPQGCFNTYAKPGFYFRQYGCDANLSMLQLYGKGGLTRRQSETWADAFSVYVYSRANGLYPSAQERDLSGQIDNSLNPDFHGIYTAVSKVLSHPDVQRELGSP